MSAEPTLDGTERALDEASVAVMLFAPEVRFSILDDEADSDRSSTAANGANIAPDTEFQWYVTATHAANQVNCRSCHAIDAARRSSNGAGSHQQDSFNPALDGLLDCPHYTRPEVWTGPAGEVPVPEVLLSGHHGRIEAYRRAQRLATTARWRPDVLAAVRAAGGLSADDEKALR